MLDQRRGGKARAGQEESEARVTFDDAEIEGIRKDGGNDGEKFRERTRDDVEITREFELREQEDWRVEREIQSGGRRARGNTRPVVARGEGGKDVR